jgi:CRP-like cAMP-binding protein
MHNPVIRKIETFTALSDEEKQALVSAIGPARNIGADQDIVSDGDRPSHSCVILEGFACRYKLLEDGRRQIMSFQIAGDMCDLHSFILQEMDHSIGTLTPCKVASIPHAALSDIMAKYPRVARALWRDTLIDAGVFREWMVGLGRRSSYGRIARLLCEVYVRCKAVGLAVDQSYPFPITQTALGDATGLSLVHVNRTLQQLRADGLITFQAKTVTINDWEGLKRAAEFDPRYLHLGAGDAATGRKPMSDRPDDLGPSRASP